MNTYGGFDLTAESFVKNVFNLQFCVCCETSASILLLLFLFFGAIVVSLTSGIWVFILEGDALSINGNVDQFLLTPVLNTYGGFDWTAETLG